MTVYEEALIRGREYSRESVWADGFDITYFAAGDAQPGSLPLVVLPGAGGPNTTSNGARLIAETRRVLLIELPGMGADVNDRTSDAEAMASTVLAFADALGITEFDLLGTSMGGVVASWVAILGGERINRLVLEAPGAFRPDLDPSMLSPDEIQRAFHRHPERKIMPEPDPEAQARRWPLVERLMGPLHDERLAARLPEVTAPALVLFGIDDGLFGTDPARTYKRLIPRANIALVYDAAHDIAGDRPDAFRSLICDFLDRGTLFAIQNRSSLIHP